MIDPADTQTQSLPLDTAPVKRGRGRPSTGKALTPAEKQRAYRERLKARQHKKECEAAGVEYNARRMKEELMKIRQRAIKFEGEAIYLREELAKALAEIERLKSGNVTE